MNNHLEPIEQKLNKKLDDANLRLIAEQKKQAAIFYGAECALVIFKGPEFIIEECNEKYQAIYGQRQVVGKPILEAVPELIHSPYPGYLKHVYETGKHHITYEGMARLLNPLTGEFEERYFDTTFSRINYGDNEPYRIIATPREVTERVHTRKKLEASLEELKQEQVLRERFISALSHDLRTPLAITKVGAQLIKRKSEDPDVTSMLAEKIVASMDRADRMIRDLLDANRIKAGEGLPLSIQPCRLDLIVSYVVSDLEELFGKRFDIVNPKGEVNGYWDSMAIHRSIENLASNAVKYGSPESRVTISIDAGPTWVEVSVHNLGNPLSEDEQERLFNQYQRTNAALSSGQSGWGIGLNLVKGLAEAHRGTVCVTSGHVTGTTFSIHLPRDSRKIERHFEASLK